MDILAVFADFVFALNHGGDAAALHRAVAETVRVRRYGYHGTRHEVLEQFDGVDQLQQWLQRTPAVVQFQLQTETLQTDGSSRFRIRYHLTAPDEFEGGGLWQATVGGDGRLLELDHRPDDLDPKYGAPVQEATRSPHHH